MKKGVIKCGLLLALPIMLGLSLSVCSDTNALKYNQDLLPFSYPVAPGINLGIQLYRPLRFSVEGMSNWMTNDDNDFSIRLKADDYYYYNLRFDDSKCIYSNHHSLNGSTNSAISNYSFPYFLRPTDDSFSMSDFPSGNYICNTDSHVPNLDIDSIPPYSFGQPNLRSYVPYRFDHNSAFLRSTVSKDGLNQSAKLDMTSLAGSRPLPGYFHFLDFPIGYSTKFFASGSTLEFKGEWLFDSGTGSEELYVNPNGTVTLTAVFYRDYSAYLTHNASSSIYRVVNVNCSFSKSQNPNPDEAPWIFSYDCPVTVPIDSSLSGFTILFDGGDTSDHISRPFLMIGYLRSWLIDSSIVITDGDDSSASSDDSFFANVFIGNASNAPGYAGNSGIPDYDSSLSNLFDFSFLNPFQSIFGMFSGGDNTCVHIPTIANMIYLEDDTVCPVFSSDIKSITTPIISLSSMMLLFGFAVRWLGARSGNFIEDSGGEDWGHYHFQNKFRRKS